MNEPFPAAPLHTEQIRVMLIEDNHEVRETLAEAVRKSPALRLMASFRTAEEGLRSLQELAPQVAVVDIGLPAMDGIACTHAIRRALPQCEVLILTVFDDADLVVRALKAGATGYLIKNKHAHKLAGAIVDVWSGGAPMSACVARKVVESFHAAPHPVRESLSHKEEQILSLLTKGRLNKEIADTLGIADATVRFHLKNIYGKLQVNNRTEAAVKYLGGMA